MPCPPSYDELLRARVVSSWSELRRLRSELASAREVLLDAVTDPAHELSDELMARARRVLEQHVPADTPSVPAGSPKEETLLSREDDLQDLGRYVEAALCQTRSLIAEVHQYGALHSKGDRRGSHVGRISDEIAAHLEHRRNDRAHVLANLRRALERAQSPEHAARIQARIDAVEALTERELLVDRDTLLRLNDWS